MARQKSSEKITNIHNSCSMFPMKTFKHKPKHRFMCISRICEINSSALKAQFKSNSIIFINIAIFKFSRIEEIKTMPSNNHKINLIALRSHFSHQYSLYICI